MGSQLMMTDHDIAERKRFDLAVVNQSVSVDANAAALFNSEVGANINSTMMMSGLTDRDALASVGVNNNYALTSSNKKKL